MYEIWLTVACPRSNFFDKSQQVIDMSQVDHGIDMLKEEKKMYYAHIRMFVVFVLIVALVLTASAFGQGNKARVSISVESKTGDCSSGKANAMGDMLADALDGSGKFVIPDAGANITLSAKVKEFEPEVKQGGAFGALKKKALGAVGAESKIAKVKWEITLTDANSGKKIKKLKIEGKSTDWSVDAADSYFSSDVGMAGELVMYSGKPMEDAIKELLSKTVSEVTKNIPGDFFAYSDEEQTAAQEVSTSPEASSGGSIDASPASGQPAAEDMKLYTKYDFVPGNKVIFYDDMVGEEEGEFPYRWNLDKGVYEVVRLGNEFWIMATDNGSIRPKMPDAPLPPKYTVELEFYNNGDYAGNYFQIHWVNDKGKDIGVFGISSRTSTWLTIKGDHLASKPLVTALTKGVHIMRIMATERSMKCFIDQERVANVPKIDGFNPVGFRLHHRPYRNIENPTLFRGFRFAEGGKSMREQLDETGRIVTHGILFESGSSTIKGQSFKTLKNIGNLLNDNPELRLSIEGHTDSDGADDYNMTLSQQRAESVRTYLIGEYGIAADRLEAKGWGETKPIDVNSSPEGKANNRRVELVKL